MPDAILFDSTIAKSAVTSPAGTELVRLVEDPGGTPVSRKITMANIKAYASASPTLVTPALGTPSSGTLTSCTGLPVAGIAASTVTALGVGSVELGHATDTTLARASAGEVSVEGVTLVKNNRTVSAAGLATGGGDLSANRTITVTAEDAAGFRTGTATNEALTAGAVWDAGALVALTDAATVAVDLATGINFSVTLAGNRTLGNPTNTKVGQTGIIQISQDATGSRTLAYSANWEFVAGTAPVLTTTASAKDILVYKVLTATSIYAELRKGVV